MRQSGILLHITSLPSPYGIGSMGAAAYGFIDFLRDGGQKCWQVLPLGPTGYGDSPYQSASAFGGNPYLIDLDILAAQGLLTAEEIAALFWGDDPEAVDYGAMYENRLPLLRKAFARFTPEEEYRAFLARAGFWLEDYVLFQALKEHFGGQPWSRWPEDIRLRDLEALARYGTLLSEQMDFHRFVQFEFFIQWEALRAYAHSQGIQIIGDVPLYPPLDSADVWANPHLFQLDENRRPIWASGVPPDYFSPEGQLWGNPIYDWERMEADGFAWWIRRIRWTGTLFDTVRIDHFRGLESYWAVPAEAQSAAEGQWRPGPGRAFVDAVKRDCGSMDFIAEDLGFLTPEVWALQKYTGWPGMKVLNFAFSPDGSSPYLPKKYERNAVCYTGTHDNMTLAQWTEEMTPEEQVFARQYLKLGETDSLPDGILRAGMASRANRFLCPMQDWLGLGPEARMNTPGLGEGWWRWRMLPGAADKALAEKIKVLTRRCGR